MAEDPIAHAGLSRRVLSVALSAGLVAAFSVAAAPAAYAAPGELTVTVTDHLGADVVNDYYVNVYDEAGNYVTQGWLYNTNTYTFWELEAGDYYLSADAIDGLQTEFLGGTPVMAGAPTVTVADDVTTNVDFELSERGTVSGTVDRDNVASVVNPAGERRISLLANTGTDWVEAAWGWTDATGAYTVTGVVPADYKVGFRDHGDNVAYHTVESLEDWAPVQYWENVDEILLATTVTVTAGADSEADATLTSEASFSDTTGNVFESAIQWMVLKGISTGYEDGTFRPSKDVSRQAMAAFVYRFAGSPTYVAPVVSPFTDVSVTNPFYKEIAWMAEEGISEGYEDGRFRPSAEVSRQAMAAFLYRAAGEPEFEMPATATLTDVPLDHTFSVQIEWMAAFGYAEGYEDDTFKTTRDVSRQAMAAFMYRQSLPQQFG